MYKPLRKASLGEAMKMEPNRLVFTFVHLMSEALSAGSVIEPTESYFYKNYTCENLSSFRGMFSNSSTKWYLGRLICMSS